MAVFPDASDFEIKGGTFNDAQGNISQVSTTTNIIIFRGDSATQVVNLGGAHSGFNVEHSARRVSSHTSEAKATSRTVLALASHENPTRNEPLCARQSQSGEELQNTINEPQGIANRRVSTGPTSTHVPVFGVTQISFTLTPKAVPVIESSSRKVEFAKIIWQVFDISDKDSYVELTIPKLVGFGTVAYREDDTTCIYSPQFLCGPPGSLVTLSYQNAPCWLAADDVFGGSSIKARNESKVPRKFALGTCRIVEEQGSSTPIFSPILVTEPVLHGQVMSVEPEFILQAYRTRGLQAGQVMTNTVLSESEPLFPEGGVEIHKFSSIVKWYVVADSEGR